MRKRLRSLLSRSGDSALAVALVVVCFLVFTIILVLSFPKGSGLSTVFQPGAPLEETAPATPAGRAEEWNAVLAHLAAVRRTVKSRQAGSIVWSSATQGVELHERDAVQTFRDSGATIAFVQNQEISLGENSLVVIRRFEREAASGTHRASVVLLGGSIDGAIASATGAPTTVEILAGKATATIASPRSGTTRFRIAAASDDSSVVTVSAGQATVRVGDRAVTVNAGQAVNVGPGGEIEGPAALPNAPILVKPENGALFATRVPPAEVVFEWKDDRAGRSYRVEIARDASFKEPVVDERVSATSFTHPGFPLGRYYWRVRSVRGPSEGRLAKPRAFEIVSDTQPPVLRVEFPEGPLQHGEIVVRGATEPGARVFVGKSPAVVGPDGVFEGRVALSRGVQILVVEAVDTAGNVAYESRTLAAR